MSILDKHVSTNMSTIKCVSSLTYFSEHIVWARCRKPLKAFLIILESIHEFGLICMFGIVYFRFTLDSYFLLVVLLVLLMSRKFSECLWSSNSTIDFIAGSCLSSICVRPLLKTCVAVICKASERFRGNFAIQGFHYYLIFEYMPISTAFLIPEQKIVFGVKKLKK